MAFNTAALINIDPDTDEASGSLLTAIAANMVPDDIDDPDEEIPAVVATMAKGIADGLQPFFDYVGILESDLEALSIKVSSNTAIVVAANASLTPLVTDFGSLTGGFTGLEGLLSQMQTTLAALSVAQDAASPGGA